MAAITITKENFQSEVLESKKTVIIDFWAAWCGPCQMLSPVVDEIAAENPDIKVGKVNVDDQVDLAKEFHILSIPTLGIFKNGQLIHRSTGVQPKESILALLK
ncbi:hypothetical protein AB840_00905 [Megasphaera cerevisiae DSM 20462]|jgi:thioredoxin 1|uniref:Thioredoxin n=1 Tax=Megasphaera cerevisiae DSM 20462 TaxID=1122219 RepID=A0A0J6ZRZ1_9FIRM|nr:thioredoxin [Megasphaera cerevisiae]KMO87721.1 hypothetical protein AB840_00905 [Megasphaera cerevisiae DSM 20462]OKY53353.1 thioredoxin [Megasphaera cerevisiae]SJZ64476.1 thioredoxin [Megasphaera cerevisiae DSM 20462]